MTNDEERALARRIQGGLHGAGLGEKSGFCNADNTKVYVPAMAIGGTGWGQVPNAHLPSGPVVPTTGYLKVSTPVTDSERMIQMLDELTSNFRQLSVNAENRLAQFCNVRFKAKETDAKQAVDARQCESSYFRILESRIEMLTESMEHLNGLINSVSAPSQGSIIQSAGSAGSTLKSY